MQSTGATDVGFRQVLAIYTVKTVWPLDADVPAQVAFLSQDRLEDRGDQEGLGSPDYRITVISCRSLRKPEETRLGDVIALPESAFTAYGGPEPCT